MTGCLKVKCVEAMNANEVQYYGPGHVCKVWAKGALGSGVEGLMNESVDGDRRKLRSTNAEDVVQGSGLA